MQTLARTATQTKSFECTACNAIITDTDGDLSWDGAMTLDTVMEYEARCPFCDIEALIPTQKTFQW